MAFIQAENRTELCIAAYSLVVELGRFKQLIVKEESECYMFE